MTTPELTGLAERLTRIISFANNNRSSDLDPILNRAQELRRTLTARAEEVTTLAGEVATLEVEARMVAGFDPLKAR